jgi:hypothetical protein
LFLLADLLGNVERHALEQLEWELARDAYGVESRAMLAQAQSLARREPIEDDPALRPFVVWKYATVARTTRLFAVQAPGWGPITHVPLERVAVRRAEYGRLLADVIRPLPVESSLGARGWLGSLPARALGLPRAVRGAYRLWLVSCLFTVGGVIRRHIRSLDSNGKGVD